MRLLGLWIAGAVASGCTSGIEGPAPRVFLVRTSLLCAGSQTVVEVEGEGLSPLATASATPDPRLVLPEVVLRRVADPFGVPASDQALTLAAERVRWSSSWLMAFTVDPDLDLAPGLYDLTVTNRNRRAVTLAAALTIVPRPMLEVAAAQLLCVAGSGRTIRLRGNGFIQVGDQLPQVEVDGSTLPVSGLDDCRPLVGPLSARWCTDATVEIPRGLDPGLYPVTVTNPLPGCEAEPVLALAVLSGPVLAATTPDLVCNAEDRTLRLSGTGFVAVGDLLPLVTIGSLATTAASTEDCTPVPNTDAGLCTALTVTVPAASLSTGIQEVVVTNPDPVGCATQERVTIATLSAPSLAEADPNRVCFAGTSRSVTLRGAGFAAVGGALPTVTVGSLVLVADSVSGCADVPGTTLPAQTCDTLTVLLPDGALSPGIHGVTVTNPEPAGCASSPTDLRVVPVPVVTQANPDLLCTTSESTALTIDGARFIRMGSALPTVSLGGLILPVDSVSGCEAAGTDTESCSRLSVTVPATVPMGVLEVTVMNPGSCPAEATVAVASVPAPTLTDVAASACGAEPPAATLSGAGFLVVDGARPEVSVAGRAVTITNISGCATLGGTTLEVATCTGLTVAVAELALAEGTYLVAIRNPAPAACNEPTQGLLAVTAGPTVTSVEPATVCGSSGSSFVVNGSGFQANARIFLGSGPIPTEVLGPERLRGMLPDGATAGAHDLAVRSGSGCSAMLADGLVVADAPVIFFVDPPVVYNGITLEATIYVSGVSEDVASLGIRPAGTSDPLVPLDLTYDLSRPSRVLGVLPEALAEGAYDVVLADTACSATLEAGFRATATLGLDLTAIDPPFGPSTHKTPVEIRATGSLTPIPRAYLDPSGATGLAHELRAVSCRDASTLTAVVPEGLPPATYDLIVVNPGGAVGLLAAAYRVLAAPPPRIDELAPALISAQPGQDVTLWGQDISGPVSVQATCHDAAGVTTIVNATVHAWTAASVATTWDMGPLTAGQACVVRLTNADGAYADFSALTVTAPSHNLADFQAATPMVLRRRAAAGAAVRMNSLLRFLFAIGGDQGVAAERHATVEAAPVGPFGEVGTWAIQRNALPEGRSFASAAVVGRHVFLVGGNTGAASASVLRACLLDPFEAPELTDVDLEEAGGTGLGGGSWTYRVAAVMGSSDPNNPGGEGLPSDPLVVQLPDRPSKLRLSLFWTQVPGAAAYRIYRTAEADGAAGDERFLGEVPASLLAFTDEGTTAVDSGRPPLPVGSLGVWHESGVLTTAREGSGVVVVPDPNQGERWFLYAIGGRNEGTALATYERATVTVSAPSGVSLGGFDMGDETLLTGRWQLGVVAIDTAPTQTWLYALPGMTADISASVNEVTAFLVDAGNAGRLGAPIGVPAPATGGGYGCVAGDEFLYLLGAAGGAPSATGRSAKVCEIGEPGCSGGPPDPPDLASWNAGITLTVPRYLPAAAAESGFIFLLGGETDAEPASASTERTSF